MAPGGAVTHTRGVRAPTRLVLVEGESDRRALEVLATRRGLDLAAAGVEVVAMQGITNLRRHLAELGPDDHVTGLYDAAEGGYVSRVLARTRPPARFFACDADLEDELVRALGHAAVIDVIDAAGDLAAYHSLRQQPFHRHRPESEVLRRFMGTTSGRKLRYAGLLTAALDLDRVPAPLCSVLTRAAG